MTADDRRRVPVALLLLAVLVVLAWVVGNYDLSSFHDRASLGRASASLASFLRALGSPDLSRDFLARGARLALTTAAIAVLGTVLAVALGFLLGLAASRNVVVGDARGSSRNLRRFACGTARLFQDVLRGVPDFAWAIMAIPILGLGPSAGVGALALNTGGILGRIYSELFDTVPPRMLEPLRACGAGRLQTFFYGVLPAARTGALSLSLLRWECAVRNAAVIGVVGGGGLGSEISLRLSYGEYPRVMTLLLFLVLLTVGSDVLSAVVRSRLRGDPDLPTREKPSDAAPQRRRLSSLLLILGVLTGAAALYLSPAFGGVFSAERWSAAGQIFGGLLRPDLSAAAIRRALESAAVPLSMAFLGTALAAAAAAPLCYLASSSFQVLAAPFAGRRSLGAARVARLAMALLARGLAVLCRALPEVFWAMLLVSFFRLGTLPGMVALAIHSVGLLTRIFAESVDALPLRTLEIVHGTSGSMPKTFVYAAVPTVLPEWIANTFFQFESNVRSAIVLGIVGVGGLGFQFSFEFEFFRFERAGTYALVMVALAVGLDRLSRWLGLARTRLGE